MVTPLDKRYLSDDDASRLYSVHNFNGDPDLFCPTCQKDGKYLWPDQETEVICDCAQQLQYYKHYLNSGIGALYQRLDWPDFQGSEPLLAIADQYFANEKKMIASGIGVTLMGSIGTGKTLFANLVLKTLLHHGYTVFSVTFAGLLQMFTAGWKSDDEQQFFLERVRKVDVLLIDDIGKEYKTKTGLGSSTFDLVLRSRVQDGKPTFITTNMTEADMREGYGSAVLSLLMETNITQQVSGSDYRPVAGQRKVKEIMSGLTRPIV